MRMTLSNQVGEVSSGSWVQFNEYPSLSTHANGPQKHRATRSVDQASK